MTEAARAAADHYRLLGINPDATVEEVRAAYRDKVRLWHPDLVAGDSDHVRQTATQMTARLNRAYECLSDPKRRAAYDTNNRADIHSARGTTRSRLIVTPQTMRCEITPGDTVRLTLDILADIPPGGEGLRIHTSNRLVATFTTTSLTATSARLTLRAKTSPLEAHRTYRIPITVTWGALTGTATLVVRTKGPGKGESRSERHRPRSNRRVRDLTTVSLGGIVLPLLILIWASGLLPTTPANPALVGAVCAGIVAATIWLLTSSRLLRHPDRLGRVSVVWGHLMRWTGRLLLGGSAVFLVIPALGLTLIGLLGTPFLGLIVFAFITSRFDSHSR